MQIFGSVFIVTGGVSGLGAAVTRHLIALGAKAVVAFDLDEDGAQQRTADLGDQYQFQRVDVSDPEAVDNAVNAVHAEHGALHGVVNAAAIPAPAKLLGKKGPLPLDVFDRGIKINLYGPVHVMRSAVALMAAGHGSPSDGERGVIINVSSGAAYEGQVGQVAYSASKAALVGLTLPLARELAEHGIRVMTIAPGAFETPMYELVPQAVKEGLMGHTLFPKRFGHAVEFAYLVEEIIRNPMHNGRTIRLDGGIVLPPA